MALPLATFTGEPMRLLGDRGLPRMNKRIKRDLYLITRKSQAQGDDANTFTFV